MAAEPVFLDTNILVYASRPAGDQHNATLTALERLGVGGCPLWISPQVVREYLAVVTRHQNTAPALPMSAAVEDARRFMDLFNVAEERPTPFNAS